MATTSELDLTDIHGEGISGEVHDIGPVTMIELVAASTLTATEVFLTPEEAKTLGHWLLAFAGEVGG